LGRGKRLQGTRGALSRIEELPRCRRYPATFPLTSFCFPPLDETELPARDRKKKPARVVHLLLAIPATVDLVDTGPLSSSFVSTTQKRAVRRKPASPVAGGGAARDFRSSRHAAARPTQRRKCPGRSAPTNQGSSRRGRRGTLLQFQSAGPVLKTREMKKRLSRLRFGGPVKTVATGNPTGGGQRGGRSLVFSRSSIPPERFVW